MDSRGGRPVDTAGRRRIAPGQVTQLQTMAHRIRRESGRRSGPRARWRLTWVLALLWMVPFAQADAAAPPTSAASCSRPEFTKSRRNAEKLYRDGRYAEAVALLSRARESCWSALDATDKGWLVSDLGLAALRAGQPELCRQVLAEAPPELESQSRVAKAIAHNRGLCQQQEPAEKSRPVQVFYMGLLISSPAEAPEALTREWDFYVNLWEGKFPQRRDREIDRCTKAEGPKLSDLAVTRTGDRAAVLAQLLRCSALRKVVNARPSRVSYVRDLFASPKTLGQVLPADMASEFSFNDFEPGSPESQGLTWSELDLKVRFEPHERDKEDVRFTGRLVHGLLSQWAFGDFNGDGIEDVIIARSASPEGGSAVDLEAFLVTRTQPGGRVKILERME